MCIRDSYYSTITTGCTSTGGCAGSGDDYTAISDNTPITIDIGQTENTFVVTTTDDSRDEFSQDIVIQLSHVDGTSNATASTTDAVGPYLYQLIIDDQDPIPTADFSVYTRDQAENVASGTSYINLSSETEKDVTVGYTVSAASADFGTFVATPDDGDGNIVYPEDHGLADGVGTVSITGLANDASAPDVGMRAEITTTVGTDDTDEWDEKFKIEINADGTTINATRGSTNPMTIIRIQDDDDLETVAFSTTAAEDDEYDVTNVVGDDPGANTINIPIAIAKESGKDIVLKYSIDHTLNYPGASDLYYNADYPNNENTATKGIDYSFGTSVTKNAAGDSIVTIAAGQTTVYIPLTIVDDSFDEYDQKVRVSLSLANSADWVDDAANDYYDSNGSKAGAEAELGSDYVYTFTITDDDPEPYVKFEADITESEGTIANFSNSHAVNVHLRDASGDIVKSEKTVTATFAIDTDIGVGETDYTSASLANPAAEFNNKYLYDYMVRDHSESAILQQVGEDVDDVTLTFVGHTYSYNSGTDTWSQTEGVSTISSPNDDTKCIRIYILADDIYEVDEYVNIELTASTNAQTNELVSGDHSYVYTIQNDDGMPSVTWVGANAIIQEGDPDDEDLEGDYQNTDIKVGLSAESGTDILVQYSLKAGGTAELGSDNNYDFHLGVDNADLGVSGAKTVTIPAATAAATEWTVSVPIDVWDDDVVEATAVADNENFFLQVDGYRDKGPDASWATGDDNTESVTSDNEFEVTIQDNDLPPAAFTVGSVITKTTNTDDVIADHWNPIVSGYWNSYNSGITVTVPIEDNPRLIGGTVSLIAKKDCLLYTSPSPRDRG